MKYAKLLYSDVQWLGPEDADIIAFSIRQALEEILALPKEQQEAAIRQLKNKLHELEVQA